jgi:glutaredoxin
MQIIRAVLGFLILTWDRLTPPKPMVREPGRQKAVEAETAAFTLYQLEACPFCVKVRREIRRLNLPIPMKDIGKDPEASRELLAGGKLDQVPCLRITPPAGEVQWMYESSAINAFLRERFSALT